VFWGLAEGAIAATLILLAGEAGLVALQQVITVVGLPIFLLVFMMIPALIRGFAAEDIDHVTIGKRPALSEFDAAVPETADVRNQRGVDPAPNK
jgi:choline-glycine betaine transporter